MYFARDHTHLNIRFDEQGVCNYCKNYEPRNIPKPKEELFKLVGPYRRPGNDLDCIVPFSGGRSENCYGLHLIVKELKMKPVTYMQLGYGDRFRKKYQSCLRKAWG